jgi:C1A family cysteine protease
MQQFVLDNSPIVCVVDASTWQMYEGGVVMAKNCDTMLDHTPVITGWDIIDGTPAWQVRNSWGIDWGMDGYVWVEMFKNACGIAEEVTTCCVIGTDGKTYC